MARGGPKVSTGTSTDSGNSDTREVNAPCPDSLSGTIRTRSRQECDQIRRADPPARVERQLLADVAARVRGAQVSHQVDDPVQLVGLEREHPLVVAERER